MSSASKKLVSGVVAHQQGPHSAYDPLGCTTKSGSRCLAGGRELQLQSPTRDADVQSSKLCVSFLKDWCFGRLTNPELVKHCKAELEDQQQNAHPAIKLLSGIDPRQGNRDVFSKLSGMVIESLIEVLPASLVEYIVVPHFLLAALAQDAAMFKRHSHYASSYTSETKSETKSSTNNTQTSMEILLVCVFGHCSCF